ncbi:hypothetical protein Axy10_054 [Achromobacter phage vB_AxyP_19-32_Axy10]|uniref:Uncharacterized protein n=1 Tax=Achromobacter phage vB_AxyP_19-32_Axy10 TaxID=2591041 RepID=A0A514CTZ3_9CAUD|nr:hypothetical protein KMC59_gp64 [Achromobacter phage vB_AxyP_19-32_Axy10]QDH83945.1 hypothetical protein Axy10_054 [Achromobacter phage vB_AxyP_19-32_Axy10]
MRNWGLAFSHLDLEDGTMDPPTLAVVKTAEEAKGKQVRMNSYDIEQAQTLYGEVLPMALASKVIFVEVPHGSQSASGMKGYGMCIGILGALRAQGIPFIEVTESESKKLFAGDRNATKDMMIQAARSWYPTANWPMHSGKINASKAEHMADAIAAIHAGVRTSQFQQLIRLLKAV